MSSDTYSSLHWHWLCTMLHSQSWFSPPRSDSAHILLCSLFWWFPLLWHSDNWWTAQNPLLKLFPSLHREECTQATRHMHIHTQTHTLGSPSIRFWCRFSSSWLLNIRGVLPAWQSYIMGLILVASGYATRIKLWSAPIFFFTLHALELLLELLEFSHWPLKLTEFLCCLSCICCANVTDLPPMTLQRAAP